MRRARLPLTKIYTLVQAHLKDSTRAHLRQRGRPRRYSDALVLSLWLYQTLWGLSYREVLEEAERAGFPTPALSTYHYRVGQLPLKLFQSLLLQIGKVLVQRAPEAWEVLLVDGTGFGFQNRYALSWRRGERLREVRAHVRLVILALVDGQGRGILLGAAAGRSYASEVRLLREILAQLETLPPLPVVGDRGYDAVDLLERLHQMGAKPALRMKGTWRYTLRHPLRQASDREWQRWGSRRYRVEGFFGLMKLKLGSVFPLVREDLALRQALAIALLYNMDRLVLFWPFFLRSFLRSPRTSVFHLSRFFEHSQCFLCSFVRRLTLEFTCAGLAPDAPIRDNLAAQPRLIKTGIRRQVQRLVGRLPGSGAPPKI